MNQNNSIVAFSRKIDDLRFSVQSVRLEIWQKYWDSVPVINKHAIIVLQNKKR